MIFFVIFQWIYLRSMRTYETTIGFFNEVNIILDIF
jgi:hypothetical protein